MIQSQTQSGAMPPQDAGTLYRVEHLTAYDYDRPWSCRTTWRTCTRATAPRSSASATNA
jgi:hypothetical protein